MKSEKYKAVATAKLKDNIHYSINSANSSVLCTQMTKAANDPGQFKLSFMLYDLKKDEVIFEASHPNATVKWISADQIQVFLTPGIVSVRDGEEKSNSGYIYDIRMKKKIFGANQSLDK